MQNLALDFSDQYPTNAEIDARIAASDYELTVDNYCGGGGASEGIEQATGRPIDVAINHDQLAIAMHKVNHPYTRHYNESVWSVDPVLATHGRPVGVAWFSPDCRHFSRAKGGRPVSKSVRGLAWVVLKWAGLVRPRIIQLENVVEFKTWGALTRTGRVIKERKGETFRKWRKQLEDLGYVCEFREIQCSRWGVPTDRTRLFMVARCDGEPIVFPNDTHGKGLKRKKSTADYVIDWSDLGSSIFTRKKPLAENTMKRIVRGMEKYVFKDPKPFIIRIGQTGWNGDRQVYNIDRPLTTVTTKVEHCLVTPQFANMVKFRGTNDGAPMSEPLPTVSAQGTHHAMVVSEFEPVSSSSQSVEVIAFLIKYFGAETGTHSINTPLATVTSKSRFGLVVVEGELCNLVDVKFRMLQPHELFAAHGFPERYTFTHDIEGNKITKTKQTALCGNSVPPEMSRRLTAANYSTVRDYSLTPIKQFKRGK